ncbi:hypothetical protein J7E70_01985 [Variovorax paradoxus]|nr:hypothetical protein [Variovorax paradoxus]MBT2299224.1 hypothetical protein [Variovorax paradoxus]
MEHEHTGYHSPIVIDKKTRMVRAGRPAKDSPRVRPGVSVSAIPKVTKPSALTEFLEFYLPFVLLVVLLLVAMAIWIFGWPSIPFLR